MKKHISFLVLASLIAFTACVPAKKFKDLEKDFDNLEQANAQFSDSLNDCEDFKTAQTEAYDKLKEDHDNLVSEKEDLDHAHKLLQDKYDNLKEAYNTLGEKSNTAMAENAKKNRELIEEIEKKQGKLDTEKAKLTQMESDLAARSKRIDQLESEIAAKENQMRELKDKISAALTDFEGKGLTVKRKNGKVYVSMENKLLFKSGSWAVNSQGKTAVEELGKVLADNPDIHVLIEGHTDNVPYGGSGNLSDNWDLSTKRATSIVHILLENNAINPKQLTAAGRSSFSPVASNASAEGKAKNRRIEVILTPEWDKLTDILNSDD